MQERGGQYLLPTTISRREAIRRGGIAAVGVAGGLSGLLEACSSPESHESIEG